MHWQRANLATRHSSGVLCSCQHKQQGACTPVGVESQAGHTLAPGLPLTQAMQGQHDSSSPHSPAQHGNLDCISHGRRCQPSKVRCQEAVQVSGQGSLAGIHNSDRAAAAPRYRDGS